MEQMNVRTELCCLCKFAALRVVFDSIQRLPLTYKQVSIYSLKLYSEHYSALARNRLL